MNNMPSNKKSEQFIIGSMILNNNLIPDVIENLTPDDFYNKENRHLFETICELTNKNRAIDALTLEEYSKNIQFDYIIACCDMVSTTESITYHISIIKGKSIRRQVIEAAQNIQKEAYDGIYDNIVDFYNNCTSLLDIDVNDKKNKESSIAEIAAAYMQNVEELSKNKELRMPFGFSWLDKLTGGLKKKDLTIIGARPGVGKSAFALNVVLNIARKGNHVAVFNLEMSKESMIGRLISSSHKISSEKLRDGKLDEKDWITFGEASSYISQMNINMYDDIFNIENIRAKARQLKQKGQLDLVVIDYLQLIGTLQKTQNKNHEVSIISRQLKLMSHDLDIPVICLSQLNRANAGEPTLRDLRDSGAIEQDANNVLFLHNEKDETEKEESVIQSLEPDETFLIIAKQRNGVAGKARHFLFYKNTQTFAQKAW